MKGGEKKTHTHVYLFDEKKKREFADFSNSVQTDRILCNTLFVKIIFGVKGRFALPLVI